MRQHFDIALIIPLEEEFELVIEHFQVISNLSSDTQIIFSATILGSPIQLLLIKQNEMGRTAAQIAVSECLKSYSIGLIICLGIAGAISTDVAIGDICYSKEIIDVLDNAKITQKPGKSQSLNIAFAPVNYSSPREVTVALAVNRIDPATRGAFIDWQAERLEWATRLIPNEFSGRSGKESIKKPSVYEGVIVCAQVSSSPAYNKLLKDLNRKLLAIETESGGIFPVATQANTPALTIRGISDYAGMDKNAFEKETGNKARTIAACNAASYLVSQIKGPSLESFLMRRRPNHADMKQAELPLALSGISSTTEILLDQDILFEEKLRDLAPGYNLLAKGYKLPVPRVKRLYTGGDVSRPTNNDPREIREVLKDDRVIVLHLPRDYPDLSLSWIVASDLLSAQIGTRQILPTVIEAKNLQRPNSGVAQLIAPEILAFADDSFVRLVVIVDDFNFGSPTKNAYHNPFQPSVISSLDEFC